ncbi:MAG TPA: YtxH domain-containing protein [Flavobacteriaceae bacterium]|nr:YtxH domain-containing protein [Flavobacteriaceae bacterium]
MSNNTGQTLLALLTGAAIGAGIALLYAPDKGLNTRKRIGKSARKIQEDLENKIEEAKSLLSNKSSKLKDTVSDRLEEVINDANYKADDVLKALEEKLKALKAQSAKLQKK